jgi:glucan phosphoethanolaminetransferase (alkaline phosphatase superfamily)
MFRKKNNLDEMQEQKLLKIEHYGFWFVYWGLLAAILLQVTLSTDSNNKFHIIAGEWLVFMLASLYIIIACLINGIWDRRLKPNVKTNIIISLLASVLSGILFFVSSYYKYGKLAGAVATGVFTFAQIFILSFGALTLCVVIYKKRVRKLEAEDDAASVKNE